MIVKSPADVKRFMEQDGVCGYEGDFCSQSCEEQGLHVAVTMGGRVFARGIPFSDRRQRQQILPEAA